MNVRQGLSLPRKKTYSGRERATSFEISNVEPTSVDRVEDQDINERIRPRAIINSKRTGLKASTYPLKPVRLRRSAMISTVVIRMSATATIPDPTENSHCGAVYKN